MQCHRDLVALMGDQPQTESGPVFKDQDILTCVRESAHPHEQSFEDGLTQFADGCSEDYEDGQRVPSPGDTQGSPSGSSSGSTSDSSSSDSSSSSDDEEDGHTQNELNEQGVT